MKKVVLFALVIVVALGLSAFAWVDYSVVDCAAFSTPEQCEDYQANNDPVIVGTEPIADCIAFDSMQACWEYNKQFIKDDGEPRSAWAK